MLTAIKDMLSLSSQMRKRLYLMEGMARRVQFSFIVEAFIWSL